MNWIYGMLEQANRWMGWTIGVARSGDISRQEGHLVIFASPGYFKDSLWTGQWHWQHHSFESSALVEMESKNYKCILADQ